MITHTYSYFMIAVLAMGFGAVSVTAHALRLRTIKV